MKDDYSSYLEITKSEFLEKRESLIESTEGKKIMCVYIRLSMYVSACMHLVCGMRNIVSFFPIPVLESKISSELKYMTDIHEIYRGIIERANNPTDSPIWKEFEASYREDMEVRISSP